jgi:GDPmannose 4,6-dehydratase
MTDSTNLVRIIDLINPDEIYNLAAQSHVHVSFETPEYTANADALGVTRILEAIRILKLTHQIKYYQASTSEMFGLSGGIPLNESSNFRPRSPYGVAKLYGYWMTINYREAYGIFASNGILFNHESSRRGETFVTKKIVSSAVKIYKKEEEVLVLGNLNAVRDWGHALDFVEGMWKILQYSKAEDWVLATGRSLTVREFCSQVFHKIGIEISWRGNGLSEEGVDQNGKVRIKVDPRYFRPTEVPHLLGDASKAKALLGWEPKITLEALIEEMIDAELQN